MFFVSVAASGAAARCTCAQPFPPSCAVACALDAQVDPFKVQLSVTWTYNFGADEVSCGVVAG